MSTESEAIMTRSRAGTIKDSDDDNHLDRDHNHHGSKQTHEDTPPADGPQLISVSYHEDLKVFFRQTLQDMATITGTVVTEAVKSAMAAQEGTPASIQESHPPTTEQFPFRISTTERSNVTDQTEVIGMRSSNDPYHSASQESHYNQVHSAHPQPPAEELSSRVYNSCQPSTSGLQPVPAQENNTGYHQNYNHIKLPPFTGKEKWTVWYNRFMEVAHLRRWNNEQKLLELLPRLQGPAGEFVYEQLTPETRRHYDSLVEELHSRFRVVETSKTFRALFGNRDQLQGETPESYAAELKRLYDKAYPNRDRGTRSEDLLRRFLSGLLDEGARFHIEYVKDPEDMDHAVYEVVNFQETKRRQPRKESTDNRSRRPTRQLRQPTTYETLCMVAPSDSDNEDEESEKDQIRANRAPVRGRKSPSISRPHDTVETQVTQEHSDTKAENPAKKSNPCDGIKEALELLTKRLDKLEVNMRRPQNKNDQNRNPPNRRSNPRPYNSPPQPSQARNGDCFNCGEPGHFARECPHGSWMTGQMHVAVQPGMYNQMSGSRQYSGMVTRNSHPVNNNSNSPANPTPRDHRSSSTAQPSQHLN